MTPSANFKVLKLTLQAKWFNLIAQGVKTEEYREIKPWTVSRLVDRKNNCFRKYDFVEFANGYSKTAPRIRLVHLGTCIGTSPVHWEWGEPSGEHYVIRLGERVI